MIYSASSNPVKYILAIYKLNLLLNKHTNLDNNTSKTMG